MRTRFHRQRNLGATAAIATLVLAAPAARAQTPVNFSVVGGLSLPMGDLARTAGVGVNLGLRGEGRRMASGWSLRGDMSYDRYTARGPANNYSYVSLAGNLVHRANGASGYQFGGLGIYTSRVTRTNVADATDTSLGVQMGVGADLTRDRRVFGEAGLTGAFTSGHSSVWFPIRIGMRF